MELIIARHRWTLDDYLKSRRYAERALKTNGVWLMYELISGFPLAAMLQEKVGGVFLRIPFLVLAILMTSGLFFLSRTIQNKFAGWRFDQQPGAHEEVTWKFSDSDISRSIPLNEIHTNWRLFKKVASSPAGFLLVPVSDVPYFIPIRAFENPAEIGALKSLALARAREFQDLN